MVSFDREEQGSAQLRPSDQASLDPQDWAAFANEAHQLLDRVLIHLQGLAEGPVWRPIPAEARAAFQAPLPLRPLQSELVHAELCDHLLPNGVGNTHPRFFGWAHGAGTPEGVLAELVTAALNTNAGGREHIAVYVERQVIAWMLELFGFPRTASGVIVTGTSMANLVAVQVARTAALPAVRSLGVAGALEQRHPGSRGLVAYASEAVHSCVIKAMEVAGLGAAALRRIPLDPQFRISLPALAKRIQQDLQEGWTPFLLVGNAGTVDTGAFDDFTALRALADRHRMWFHVDGAFGAFAVLSPRHRVRISGLERADSLAFDFHKWVHVPYDAGCVLVRHEPVHRATFEMEPDYLQRSGRGTAAGEPWFCDYGPELSRQARAIKVWATLRAQGLERLGAAIAHNCDLAVYAADLVGKLPEFELMAPVPLNVVCFRHRPAGWDDAALDRHNAELACDIQESGVAVVSTTRVHGHLVLRLAILNHRSQASDIERTLATVAQLARQRAGAVVPNP